SAFTPWFKLIASKFLFPWWDQLLSRGKTVSKQVDTLAGSKTEEFKVYDAKVLADLKDDEIHRML
ncbi:hypothetical protein CF326_g7889, partial [Tilletia indica]